MEKLQEQTEDSDSDSESGQSASCESASKALPSFWEAYRILGQCYEAEIARPRSSPSAPSGPRPRQLQLPDQLPLESPSGTSLSPQVWRNTSFNDSNGVNSERLLPMVSSMSRRNSQSSVTLTAKAAEEAVARALGHRLQHVLSSIETTASHCVEMKDLPKDLERPNFLTRAWWEPDMSWSPIAPRQRTSITTQQLTSVKDELATRCLQKLIICPNGKRRFFWDALSICCLLLELIFLPLGVFAADWPCSRPTFVEIFPHVFWHLDICVTFITGIYIRGELVLAPKRIASNYARGWLTFDLLYVVVNWIELMWNSCSRYRSLLLKGCQLLQRLIRLCRLNQMMESIKSRLSSEASMAQSNIIQITGQILLVHHLLACVWFAVGQLDETGGWVAVYLATAPKTVAYSYTTSLYWMFCQLGFGSTNIEPETTYERTFALMVAFMALGIFSTLLGTISATVLNLNKSMEEKRLQFRQLQQFLSHHRISDELSQRISRFLEHAWALKNEVVLESSVELLDLLSTPLRRELRYARYEHCLRELGFHAMTRQLSLQLHSKTFATADTVFEAGGVAEEAYFLSEGTLTYSWGEKKVSFTEKDKFGWLVEMCIWTPWVHVGELSTRSVSCVEIMQIEPFFDCICRSLDILQLARSHAEEFVKAMDSYAAVTDLWHPDQDLEPDESFPPKAAKRGLFAKDLSAVVPLH